MGNRQLTTATKSRETARAFFKFWQGQRKLVGQREWQREKRCFENPALGNRYTGGCISGRQLNWTISTYVFFWPKWTTTIWSPDSGRHLFFSKKTGRHVNFFAEMKILYIGRSGLTIKRLLC